MCSIPPRLAMINDMTGFGRCSSTAAIPVISVMGVQVCPAPTALFSNHMGFPFWYSCDFTPNLPDYLAQWEKLDIAFDGIYVGFLGSDAQTDIVSHYIERRRAAGTHPLVLIDPVMGDNGKAYSSVTGARRLKMKDFIRQADILTPNLTEACLLTDTSYRPDGWTCAELDRMSDILHHMGPSQIVITGIREGADVLNYVSDGQNSLMIRSPFRGQSRPGTGDIFASVVAAGAVKNIPFPESVQKASDFVGTCTEASDAAAVPVQEGVLFEPFLKLLL